MFGYDVFKAIKKLEIGLVVTQHASQWERGRFGGGCIRFGGAIIGSPVKVTPASAEKEFPS